MQKSENYYIKEIIKSIAISHPKISFNYFENTKPKLVLLNRIKIKSFENRIIEILRKRFFESSLYLEEKKRLIFN